jgi:hypothetical protein
MTDVSLSTELNRKLILIQLCTVFQTQVEVVYADDKEVRFEFGEGIYESVKGLANPPAGQTFSYVNSPPAANEAPTLRSGR